MACNKVLAFLLVAVSAGSLLAAPAPVDEQYDNYDPVEMFEGDIAGIHVPSGASVADVQELTRKYGKNGIVGASKRWPNGIMPIVISKNFNETERAKILRAMEEFANKTVGFRVVLRGSERNYVFIARGAKNTGCWSMVGKQWFGFQQLNLQVQQNSGEGHCMHHGTIVHEMNHAAGFWHEQSRADRDAHVEINWNNIEKDKHNNFVAHDNNAATAFGVPYDYGSLMHYAKYDFAINRTIWTIRGKGENENVPLGNNVGLTQYVVDKLNFMYPGPAPV